MPADDDELDGCDLDFTNGPQTDDSEALALYEAYKAKLEALA